MQCMIQQYVRTHGQMRISIQEQVRIGDKLLDMMELTNALAQKSEPRACLF